MKAAFVSFRIGVPLWMPESRFEELLGLFDRNPGVTDEIALFTSETHPPLPMAEIVRRADILSRRMGRARQRGHLAGVNVLATVGHHEENLPHSLSGSFTPMTDIEGRVCRGSLCPNDERLREYVRELYRHVTNAGPDFIWIDDDVRLMGHMPIRGACFCDGCLRLFSEAAGRRFDRSMLQKGFDTGDTAGKLDLRKAWLEHNRRTLSRLMTLIEQTVHDLRPGLPIGFMTGERYFEGYGFDELARVLAGPGGAPVRWRPGGGFYADKSLDDLVGKSHEIGRQVSLLPPQVASIQSEIENFPYQRLKKAARTTMLEAAYHIAAGCTGAAFNVLSMHDEPLDEYAPLVSELARGRAFLDRLAGAFRRDPPLGVFAAWSKDSYASHNLRAGSWMGEGEAPFQPGFAEEIYQIGIPPAYAAEAAAVTLFSGDALLAWDEARLRQAFSGGVYLDARALECLHQRSMGGLAGFRVGGYQEADCIEELTAHPLNGALAGRRRDGRQSFWKSPAALLVPTAAGALPVARLVDYAGGEICACGMGVFENPLGGRVCVAGYCPWTFLQNLSKSTQMKAVLRWLSRDTLPLYVESFHRLNVWARRGESTIRFGLINASLDLAEGIVLLIKTRAAELQLLDARGTETRVAAGGSGGGYRRFELPPVGAWEMVLGTQGR